MMEVEWGVNTTKSEEIKEESKRIKILSKTLYDNLTTAVPEIYLNGDEVKRYHGNLNLSFAYIEGESMILALKDIAVSSGSACTSSSLEPSYVLRALGVDEELAHTSIRFGIGRFTTKEEIDFAVVFAFASLGLAAALDGLGIAF